MPFQRPSESQYHDVVKWIREHKPILARRGRGQRKNEAYWNDYNENDSTSIWKGRECLVDDGKGHVLMPAMANLDSGLDVPGGLVMASDSARELGRYGDISQDFQDPCLRSVCGQLTPTTGILRDVVFRLKGTSVTFKRDFYVCDAINGLADLMFGGSFMQDQFRLLFEGVKTCFNMFATWFSTKKESPEEKAERRRREKEAELEAHKREVARLEKDLHKSQVAQRRS
ncbi:hypothetical protein LTR85_000134 [Meristemomyces frigidus]|nr:hypothetical protein LTR85_000134 [Meristemomyces frigidus]